MKNPNSRPIKIVRDPSAPLFLAENYGMVLATLALAQSNVVKSKASAWPHFIAIVKELQYLYGFSFEFLNENHE